MTSVKRTISLIDTPAKTYKKSRVVKKAVTKKSTTKADFLKVRRNTQQHMAISLTTGFAASGFDLNLSYSLSQTTFLIGGATVYIPTLPNVAEFTNLFDQYRINRVSLHIFYSENQSNSGVQYPYPLLHLYNDYNSFGSFNLSDMQQYPNMATYQLIPGKPIVWSCRPHGQVDILTDGGLLSTSALNVSSKSQWLDTSSANIRLLGTRMYLDNQGRNTVADIGTITIKLVYDLEFKDVK